MTNQTSRAKKKRALMKLIRSIPESQEFAAVLFGAPETSEHAHDRTIGIVGAAYVERGIARAIRTHFKSNPVDPDFVRVFEDESAPLRDFAAKTRLALALGVISGDEYNDLELIRRIRNVFAHAESRIGFSTEAVSDLCGDLNLEYENRFLAEMRDGPLRDATSLASDARRKFVTAVVLHHVKLAFYPGFEKFTSTLVSLAESPVIQKLMRGEPIS